MGTQDLQPELRIVLETYRAIRTDYDAVRARNEAQAEKLKAGEAEVAKLKDSLSKATKAYLALEKRHTLTVEELRGENDKLRDLFNQLQEQLDHLRIVNNDRNMEERQTYKLEQEVDTLKAQLALQEEKHKEEMALLEKMHFDEIEKYKAQTDNTRQIAQNPRGKTNRGKRGTKRGCRKPTPCFRWPTLEIASKENPAEKETAEGDVEKVTKKRKLFFENQEKPVDII